ncbi:MAG: GDSL-type esterase/lipase family protein, partial [Planctomycetes bacterium]|nr:GDSL-type esterase/lipase family protein [Planctomycetota bacterium]
MYWGNIYPSCGQTMARMAALLVLLVVVALGERLDAAEDSDRWEATIAAFEKQDRRAPPTPGAVLFVGSSSIRLWDLTKSFPGTSMINRGFGGSEIEDSIRFAPRIVFPYQPRTIVLYAGDNDVARGKSARTVLRDFREFVRIVREALPNTRVVFIAIKPSIRRWALIETIRATNELVRRETELDDRLTYVDVDAPMISDDGRPRAELLASDGLHLSERGYRLWADLLRPHLKLEPESPIAMSATRAEYERVPLERATLRPMVGTVVEYESKLYGDRQPFAVCATDVGDVPKPLIVDLIPGTLGRVDQVPADCERMCEYAKANGFECVALRPCGRGNGTVYQGYGEVDVYEAIEAVKKLVKIDPDRVTVTGVSMGGAATWFHASHYPDVWAAAAPFCGYCNYKLWEKPGGTTFHRQPWEEFSWVSRGAAYRVENFRHVPVRITHGEWDRAVGGGVPVEHSRQMYRRLKRLGEDPGGARSELVEVPKTGHSCRLPDLWEKTIVWLLKQRRVASADHVTLVVHTLRHHRSRWVSVEQQLESGRVSHGDARFDRELQRVVASTKNVRRL